MNARSGLSLFELLVALALLALITAGLASALRMGVQIVDRSASVSQYSEEIALRARLRIWLDQATPPSRLTPFPAVLTGGADRIEFVTLAETPFAPDAAGLRVTVLTEANTLTLMAEAIDDEGQTITRIKGDLARNIVPRFSYYDPSSEPPGWRDTWGDASTLPALIRISAPSGSAPDWPEFTVKTQLR